MRYESSTDSDLLNYCQGDSYAFQEIYNRHAGIVFRIAMQILADREKAKDVVQEVFISLYVNAPKKSISNLKAYLFQSAKFQCFMQLRAGKISAKHLQKINQAIAANVVEEAYDAAELEMILKEGIAALPEKCREVFQLSRFELQSNNSIASQLNISPKTVENQISKALKVLRSTMGRLATFLLLFHL